MRWGRGGGAWCAPDGRWRVSTALDTDLLTEGGTVRSEEGWDAGADSLHDGRSWVAGGSLAEREEVLCMARAYSAV
jgi:hypothetical protein